jgi:FHA domain-containing protein
VGVVVRAKCLSPERVDEGGRARLLSSARGRARFEVLGGEIRYTMWKLTIEDDDGATREVELVSESYSIGRAEGCDLRLLERNVSRQHARLERDDEGRWWLVDLGAPYGSFINGVRVTGRAAFVPGDVAQVGDNWLGIESDAEVAPPGERPSLPWGVRSEPDRLLVFYGPDEGVDVRLDAGPVQLGVGDGVTIRLPEGVAPEGVHALVRPLPQGRYEIVRRSDALTMLVCLSPAERALLDDGDMVSFTAPGRGEVMSLRFCEARMLRHSPLTLMSDLGVRAGLARGRLLATSTLPSLKAIKTELSTRPPAWQACGEDQRPRPEGYQPPPVQIDEVPAVREPLPPTPREELRRAAPARAPARSRRQWPVVAALLALAGVAWGLTRAGTGERVTREPVGEGPTADGAEAPPASDATAIAAGGEGDAARDGAVNGEAANGEAAGGGAANGEAANGEAGGDATAAASALPSGVPAAVDARAAASTIRAASTASTASPTPGLASAKRPSAEAEAARRERCKYLGLTRCD